MKTLRIANAARYIENGDDRVTLFRIQEILTEHRSALISGILTDLTSYLQFKFNKKAESDLHAIVRNRLTELANTPVNLDRYLSIVHDIEKSDNYKVPVQPFFQEIDTVIESLLNPTQLALVK